MVTFRPTRRPPAWAFGATLTSGVLGVVGNLFLMGSFALTYPSYSDPAWSWLGFANDVIMIGQFAALVPAIYAVGRLLPASRLTTTCTALGMIAAAGIAVASTALVLGLLMFDVQVWFVVAFMIPLYGWLVAVNSVGHRASALPRSVTRFGLLLGAAWPAAALLVLGGVLIGGVKLGSQVYGLPGALLVVPGIAVGLLSWLTLPLWSLALAITAFSPGRPGAEQLPLFVDLEARR